MTLDTPISNITSIGKKVAPKLKKLGLEVARDLLFYWPYRFEDWSKVKAISELVPGDQVTVKGVLELIQNKRSRWQKRMVTEAIIADDSGKIRAVWWHQPYLTRNLKPGDELYISGRVDLGESGPQFVHPAYEKITRIKSSPTHTARIVPMYPLTKGITQKQLRYLISQILRQATKLEEWLPSDFIERYKLQPTNSSLQEMHFPSSETKLREAQHRFKFEELFLLQLRAQVTKQSLAQGKAHNIAFKESETKAIVESLPFKLTKAQKLTAWEILEDLQQVRPMNRLLEGDVGSGKTVVAALAAYNIMLNNCQVAYLAPTEILAQQQYESLSKLFANYDFKIALLTSSQQRISPPYQGGDKEGVITTTDLLPASSLARRRRILDELAVGNLDLIIGTHALIQDKVSFDKLALAIIDEQHRFGVNQRAAIIRNSGTSYPHLLSMTATPIPRSLALTVYGELDLSIINELPPGREPIETKLVTSDKRGENYRFIKGEVDKGRQAFIICPLIDPSDRLGKKAVIEEHAKLSREIFPDMKIGLLHGRLKPQDKEQVMREFAQGELDILVATPVIEVGIDIPNASVMVIESPERFGLAQLHQFRGRVGRGQHKSYCLLFVEEGTGVASLERLQALVDSQDGFALAERDLEFRGPGEVYGVQQHGFDDMLKVAKLTDYTVIKEATQAARDILETSSDLGAFPRVKEKLEQFETNIHLE